MTTSAVIHFDGGTQPDNPGPSAIGYIVETDNWTEKGNEHIGESTNNRTEYRALIQGLEAASNQGCTEVEVRGDSQLVVKQVRGEWSVNKPELRPLRNRIQKLADEFEQFEIRHIPRQENREADKLVDQAFAD
jgi:ribonuclease HI